MTWLRIPIACIVLLSILFAVPYSSVAQKQKPSWSYEGKTGPKNWAKLSDKYAACKRKRQSPINIKNAKREDNSSLDGEYKTSKATVVNRSRATQVSTTGGKMNLGGSTYRLKQFHIHTPAEHTVKGKRYPAEIHLVHRSKKAGLAVISLFVRKGKKTNPALAPLVTGTKKGEKRTINKYNVKSLLPAKWQCSYYRYPGSLTTPPCTQGVRWVVLRTPVQASAKQLEKLQARHNKNNRPRQPLNGRTVVRMGE